jgi:hypothetical protein
VTEARSTIAWLPMCVIVSRATRHLGCTLEDAKLRITCEAEARGIKACGLTVEGWPASPLAAAWCAAINWDAGQLALSDALGPYEITNVELCLDVLIAADLLPAAAERGRWPAAMALAYIVEGMPLEGKEWTAEMYRHLERAEIDLGQAIGADQVSGWGRRSPYGPIERISDGDFRAEMVEMKVPPVSATRLPKVVVRVDGKLGISPAHRFADYRGPHWSSIECDPAGLKQAFPKPLRVERRMLDEAEQLYELPAEPKQPAPKKPVRRRRRPGPRRGTIARFAEPDRALFPEMTTLIKHQHMTRSEAARKLSHKIEGRGTIDSRIRRLAERYRDEVQSLTATRRNS